MQGVKIIAKIDRTIVNRSFSPLTSSELVARGFFEKNFMLIVVFLAQNYASIITN